MPEPDHQEEAQREVTLAIVNAGPVSVGQIVQTGLSTQRKCERNRLAREKMLAGQKSNHEAKKAENESAVREIQCPNKKTAKLVYFTNSCKQAKS